MEFYKLYLNEGRLTSPRQKKKLFLAFEAAKYLAWDFESIEV